MREFVERLSLMFTANLFKNNMKRMEKQRKYLPFGVCRKREA